MLHASVVHWRSGLNCFIGALLNSIGGRHGTSVARAVRTRSMQRSFVSSVLVGAGAIDQLENNLAAATLMLTPDETGEIDQLSERAAPYPVWMQHMVHGTVSAEALEHTDTCCLQRPRNA